MNVERTTRRLPSAERSNELLRIAKALFQEQGPNGLKLREIARRAGVSAPSVYNHFASFEDLLAAIMDEQMSDIGEMHAAIAVMDPEQAVTTMCKSHTLLLADNPAAAYLLMADQQLRLKLAPLRDIPQKMSALNRAEAEIFKRGESAGVFRAVNPHDVVLARLGMTTTILSARWSNGRIKPDQVAEVGETVADFVLRLLRKETASKALLTNVLREPDCGCSCFRTRTKPKGDEIRRER